MKILIVNDDGFEAEGIKLLALKAMEFGEVIMYAPAIEQSAKSQAITCWQVLEREEVFGRPYQCFKVFGTPADCVRIATGLHKDIDLVLSGINNGFNIGIDTLYSGTVSAAIEANLHGINAISLSAPRGKVLDFSDYVVPTIKKCFEIAQAFNGEIYALNVNFSADAKEVLGYKLTKMGYFVDDLEMVEYNGGFKAAKYNLDYDPTDLDIDYTAHKAGYISISPFTFDRTNKEQFKLLKEKMLIK